MTDEIKYCYVIQYDKSTGEIKRLTMFSDKSELELYGLITDHHAANMKPENDFTEVTLDEYEQAFEKDDETHDFKNKVDTAKATKRLNDRERREVTMNEHGVSWQEIQPIDLLISPIA